MAKNHKIAHYDSENTIKVEKEKMAEVRREEEKMAHNIKAHEKCCGK